jgi:hypothetical protein
MDESGIDPTTNDLSPPAPNLPPSRDGPQQPLLDSSADQAESPAAFIQLPAVVTVKGTFDIEGVHGDFISKTTVQYLEGIPGGAKWINMVRSYTDLERLPLINTVRGLPCWLRHASDLFF